MTAPMAPRTYSDARGLLYLLLGAIVVFGIALLVHRGLPERERPSFDYEATRDYCIAQVDADPYLVRGSNAWVREVNECMVRAAEGDLRP